MVGVSNVGSSGGKSPSPSNNIGDFAALCRELISMDAKELTRIEKTTLKYHEAKAAADERIAEADRRDATSDQREADIDRRDTESKAEANERNRICTEREGRADRRDRAQNDADKVLSGREQSVSDGERRIARTHKQLGAAVG